MSDLELAPNPDAERRLSVATNAVGWALLNPAEGERAEMTAAELAVARRVALRVTDHLDRYDAGELDESDTVGLRDAGEPVSIVVGANDDEQTFAYRADAGDAEGTRHLFAATVPAEIIDAVDDAWKRVGETLDALTAAAGFDPEMNRMTTCCAGYVGEQSPGLKPSWSVAVPPSGDENVWPAGDRPASIGWGHDTEEKALLSLAELPDTVHIIGHGGHIPHAVNKADLIVVPGPGWPASWPECDRCGWSRDEHRAIDHESSNA